MRRRYTGPDRSKSAEVRLANALAMPAPDYPQDRTPGQIIKRINGQELIVDLIPKGYCNQWLAIFPDGFKLLAGMSKIDAEIRKRMPPLLGCRNL